MKSASRLQLSAPAPRRRDLEDAALRTLAYSDVFDFALTADEAHRYLVGAAATRAELEAALERLAGSRVRRVAGLYTLPGRERLAELRRQREALTLRLWPAARRQGRALARLPFVRMVAVTGALAAGNPSDDGDIDYFLVTEPDRLWLARTFVVQRVRLARVRGLELCPNYLISERALALDDTGLYAARELAQMRPIAGLDLYRRLRHRNPWVARFLPNATGAPLPLSTDPERSASEPRPGLVARLCEAALGGRFGEQLERRLSRLRIREIQDRGAELGEVTLDADRCKAHTSGHAKRIAAAYQERLDALGLPADSWS